MIEQQQPQIQQRCHCEGIGFGTILEVYTIEKSGLRTKVTTILKIQFDDSVTRKKKLTEVELIGLPDNS